MADWQEDSNAHCREHDANALCATCGKTWSRHIGRCCDGDESSPRRFQLASQVDARPVCWYEAEERCRGMPLHILLSPNGQMCHSGRFHWTVTRPNTTNPVWPLYAAAGVSACLVPKDTLYRWHEGVRELMEASGVESSPLIAEIFRAWESCPDGVTAAEVPRKGEEGR